ncbi:MAG: hypothetical protein ABR601_03225 [Parasphingopyxis sp.]|nr:hypothetical protein [Sphingomonadales bacterium]
MSSIRTLVLPLAGFATLAACGGEPGPAAGDFAAACNAAGNLDPDLCACLDEQAEGLEPDTHRFVIATIAEDEGEAQRLRGDLDDAEATQAAQFISRGIQACIIELPASEDADVMESEALPPPGGEEAAPEGDGAMAGETAMGETGDGEPVPVEQ